MADQLPTNDDERSQLAAKLFPREWATVANLPGASKARQKLRQRAVTEVKLRALRAAGASCATCRSFEKRDPTPGIKGPWCSAKSDWEGYVLAKPNDLCPDHHATPAV